MTNTSLELTILNRELSLPVDHIPLGYAALRAAEEELLHADQAAEAAISLHRLGGVGIPEAEEAEVRLLRARIDHNFAIVQQEIDLEEAREVFSALNHAEDTYREMANEALEKADDLPPLFASWRNQYEIPAEDGSSTTDWMDWLAHGASDQQLLNVMQWHNEVIRRANEDPEIQAGVQARHDRFNTAIERLYKTDYLYPDTRTDVLRCLKETKTYAADPFELAVRQVTAFAAVDGVYLTPQAFVDPEASTLEHERGHLAVTGKGWVPEVACELLAGMARTGSLDADKAFDHLHDRPAHNGYAVINAIAGFFLRDNPAATKAFLRFASAPRQLRDAYRQEFQQAIPMDDTAFRTLNALLNAAYQRTMPLDIIQVYSSKS